MKRFSALGLLALSMGLGAPASELRAQARAASADTAAHNWWHLDESADRVRGTSAARAYRELLAGKKPKRDVVVAIIDSGTDVLHPDLQANIWTNAKEIAGNGKDDDRNGYVDDRHGWNFIGGADGRHVEQDTYELTRLYGRLRTRCEGAAAAGAQECAQFPEIKREFEKKRGEAVELLERVQQIKTAMQHFTRLLQTELNTTSLTADRVRSLRTTRPELLQAQQAWLQIAGAGISMEDIDRDLKELEKRVNFGLNPDFDPRSIVGDDPAELNQRGYGNADVVGPDSDHGTHVAGIVGAVRGNNLGMEGLAPAVRLMVLRAVPDGDERDKDVANAIRYAVDNGAHVINMSFGKGHSPEKSVVDEAVRYADSKGVLMIHAAGNDAADVDSSPNFPTRAYLDGGEAKHWIEVGASSWSAGAALPAPFSNFGRKAVDVFAPGVDIYSTVPGAKYQKNSGTSMASPVVTGLAAMIMAYYPELTAAEVKQVILDSATRYGTVQVRRPGGDEGARTVAFSELSATGGVVNAYEALKLAQQRAAAK